MKHWVKRFKFAVALFVIALVCVTIGFFSDAPDVPTPIAPPSTVQKYYPCDDALAASTHVANQIIIDKPNIGTMVQIEHNSRVKVQLPPGSARIHGKLYVCGRGSKLLLPKDSLGQGSEIYMGEGTTLLAADFNPADLAYADVFLERGVNVIQCSQQSVVGLPLCNGLF